MVNNKVKVTQKVFRRLWSWLYKREDKPYILVLVLISIISFLICIVFLPERWINADEGSYLMDAKFILDGRVPFRDFMTRSPVQIYTLAAFLWIFGPNLIVGRLLPLLSTIGTCFVVFLIGRELFDKSVGLAASAIYVFSSSSILYAVVIKTEPLQSLLVCLAIYLVLSASKDKVNMKLMVFSGMLLGLAYFVRQSMLLILPAIFMFLVFSYKTSLKCAVISFMCILLGFLLPASVIFGYFTHMIGLGRAWWTFGLGQFMRVERFLLLVTIMILMFIVLILKNPSAEILWNKIKPTFQKLMPILTFLYVSIMITILTALAYLLLTDHTYVSALSKICNTLSSLMGDSVEQSWAYTFGEIKVTLFLNSSLILAVLMSIFFTLIDRVRRSKHRRSYSLLYLWITATTIFYIYYALIAAFYNHYFVEFLPPLAILLAHILVSISFKIRDKKANKTKKMVGVAILSIFLASFALSYGYLDASTGCTWSPETVQTVSEYVKAHSNPGDRIMAGGLIWAFESDRQPLLDITHPLAYMSTGTFWPWPTMHEIEKALQKCEAKYVILDGYTEQCFLKHSERLLDIINKNYILVKEVQGRYIYRSYKVGDLPGTYRYRYRYYNVKIYESTEKNSPPSVQNESPTNGAVNVGLNPTLQADVYDSNGDSVDWKIETNATGTWTTLNSGTLPSGSGTISASTSNMNNYNTKYWWSINASDPAGSGKWTYKIYSFTTSGPPTPGYEDFTTYTEVDPNNHIAISAYHIDFDYRRRESAYVYKDMGAGYFSDFEHSVDAKAVTLGDNYAEASFWGLANDVGDFLTLEKRGKTLISVRFQRAGSGGAIYIVMIECYGGKEYFDYYIGSAGTMYYFTIKKSGTTLTCEIYSDPARTNLLDTLSLTLKANHSFRYIYAGSTWYDPYLSPDRIIDIDIENLNLQ